MEIAEFQESRDKLKQALLRYGKDIERNSEAILDKDTLTEERRKRNLKKGNPFYHDIEQSAVVAYNASLKRAVGYFCFSVGDEPNEVYLVYTPENYFAMALNDGWNITDDKRVIASIVRFKNMKVLE
ncbi:MAG: hypothetical protein JSV88_04585 [Candidatus Aminicenantes bacterium]|nr:MAG: hypothetical protein JSV88_04585 [Candidatus Aminicenantes bacterium]